MPEPYDDANVFAKILRGELPCHKVYEDATALALMDIMPRADGHVLLIPKARARNIFDVDIATLAALMGPLQKIARAVRTAFAADGVTIQQFNEPAGGQIVFHLHFHILPRWADAGLRPHTGELEKPEVLEGFRKRIVATLEAD